MGSARHELLISRPSDWDGVIIPQIISMTVQLIYYGLKPNVLAFL